MCVCVRELASSAATLHMSFLLRPGLPPVFFSKLLMSEGGVQALGCLCSSCWRVCLSSVQQKQMIAIIPVPSCPTAHAAAMFYGYYMLPDGTYCLAPPPPGVESTSFYNGMASGLSAAPPSSGVGSDLASTATPPQTSCVAPGGADSSHLSTCSATGVRAESR